MKKLKKRTPKEREIFDPSIPKKAALNRPVKSKRQHDIKPKEAPIMDKQSITLFSTQNQLIITKLQLCNFKRYLQRKTMLMIQDALCNRIKKLPNFKKKTVSIFIKIDIMEYHNLFRSEKDYQRFTTERKTNYNQKLTSSDCERMGLKIEERKILHEAGACNDPQCCHACVKLILTDIGCSYNKRKEKLKLNFAYKHTDEFGINRYVNG